MYLISQACRNDELVIKNHFSPNVLHSEPDIVYDFLNSPNMLHRRSDREKSEIQFGGLFVLLAV